MYNITNDHNPGGQRIKEKGNAEKAYELLKENKITFEQFNTMIKNKG